MEDHRLIQPGRTPTKRTVQRRLPELPTLGQCQGLTMKGTRCPEKAKHQWRGTILCGRHFNPIKKREAQVENDKSAYRDHHAQHYQSQMMGWPVTELRRVIEQFAVGTIPESATVMERLRLEARRMAAEKELERRGCE